MARTSSTEDGIDEIFPEVYAGTVLKEENLKASRHADGG